MAFLRLSQSRLRPSREQIAPVQFRAKLWLLSAVRRKLLRLFLLRLLVKPFLMTLGLPLSLAPKLFLSYPNLACLPFRLS